MKTVLLSLVLILGLSPVAHGALIDNGNHLIYDTDLNITWYDNSQLANWNNATAWVASLNVGGVTGWRLPTTPGTLPPNTWGTAAFIDEGELGHLYHDELDNVIGYGYYPNDMWVLLQFVGAHVGPFETLHVGGGYYTGTNASWDPRYTWLYVMDGGAEVAFILKDNTGLAWAMAVHDGDVGAPLGTPEPGILFLSAVGMVLVYTRKRDMRGLLRAH